MSKYAKWLQEDWRVACECRARGDTVVADIYDALCRNLAMMLIWGVAE